MCYIAIPGQTGCLAIHNVPASTKRKQALKKVATPKKPASVILPYETPRFQGGTLEKAVLGFDLWDKKQSRMMRNLGAQNAKQHSRRVRPAHESHRMLNRLRAF